MSWGSTLKTPTGRGSGGTGSDPAKRQLGSASMKSGRWRDFLRISNFGFRVFVLAGLVVLMRSELADSLDFFPQAALSKGLATRSESATCLPTTWRTRFWRPLTGFGLRISDLFLIGLGGVCLRLRETTFLNSKLHKRFGQAKSSHRGFKVRRLRPHGQAQAPTSDWPGEGQKVLESQASQGLASAASPGHRVDFGQETAAKSS